MKKRSKDLTHFLNAQKQGKIPEVTRVLPSPKTSEININQSETDILPPPRRSYQSVPASTVNKSGKFNYELQRTGFLGETKMRAKRIANNPKRFLEEYADAQKNNQDSKLEFVPTELPELEHFLQTLSNETRFERKEFEMKKRSESAKHRTFLLAMSAASPVKLDPKTLAFLHSYTIGDEEENSEVINHYEDSKGMESLVENYLKQVKAVDLAPIEDWVNEFIRLSDLDLPYGLPTNIPEDLPCGTGEFGDCFELKEFIESSQDNFFLLDAQYHTKLVEINVELAQVNEALHRDWNSKESALLFYIMNTFGANAGSSPGILPLQIELIRRLFPDKSKGELTKQKYRLKSKKSLEEKRGAVIRGWIHDKAELQNKMNVAWKEVSKKRVAEMEQKQSFKKQSEICDFWAERLQKLRKEKCDQIRKYKILAEPTEKIRELKAKSIAESEAQRREAVKVEVEKYKNLKEEEEIKQRDEKEREKELEQETMKKKQIVNRKRVSYRKNQCDVKEKTKREIEAAFVEQRRKRETQLELTKEPVVINYDPANVIADTYASYSRRIDIIKKYKKVENEKMLAAFRECYSFTSEIVLKDRRLRLQGKLKEAGLLDSDYARQVLLAMEPKPKPHLQSQIKFDEDTTTKKT